MLIYNIILYIIIIYNILICHNKLSFMISFNNILKINFNELII